MLDKGRREDDDAEVSANALLTSAWLLIEQKAVCARPRRGRAPPRRRSPSGQKHSLLVLADLIGGVAEIRAGNVKNAAVAPRVAEGTLRQRRSRRIELGRGARRRDCARARPVRSGGVELQSGANESVADARTRRVDGVCDQPAVARRAGARGDCAGKSSGRHRRIQTSDGCGPRQPVVCGARASLHSASWRVC